MFGRLVPNALKAGLPGRIIKYEVMVYYDKRWVIDCIMEDEQQAIAHAKSLLLANEKNEQVRVVRQRSMLTGFTTETPIFEQVRPPKKKEIGLSASINAAPACTSLDDFFGLQARVLMNRLFREFLDSLVITPTELLHNYGYIKKLDATGNLITGAVYQVAQAQANAGQGSVKERVNALFRLVDQVKMRARDTLAERKRLPVLEAGQFGLLCRRAEARFEPQDRRYMILFTLSNYLAESRNWGQKLEQIGKLFADDVDGEGVAILDGVVADVLGAGAMIQELLGPQPNLGAALGLLADIVMARVDAPPKVASESLKLLMQLIQKYGMPDSRAVLLDRLKRELRSTKPLCRDGLSAEREELHRLEARLRDASGALAGGAEMEQIFASRVEQIRRAHLRNAGVAT
ncbi:MAG TPA: hypothetical protein VF342_08880 [Alphaproteobacteria bacterium]